MKRPDLAARNRGDGGPYEDAEWCRARYVDLCMTFQEMATEAGCSLRTIARWVKIHGIEVPTAAERRRQRGTLPKPRLTPPTCPECGGPKDRYSRACINCRDFTGERNPKYRGDEVGVGMAHQRVANLRGKATEHACQHCGIQAAHHWAYDHCDPAERTSGDGPYSTDPEHYMPLCAKCHKRFDLDHLRRAAA